MQHNSKLINLHIIKIAVKINGKNGVEETLLFQKCSIDVVHFSNPQIKDENSTKII